MHSDVFTLHALFTLVSGQEGNMVLCDGYEATLRFDSQILPGPTLRFIIAIHQEANRGRAIKH